MRQTFLCATWRARRTSVWNCASRTGSASKLSGQELQRHRLAELQIVGAIDLAHPALSDARDDAIASGEQSAGLEASVWSGRESADEDDPSPREDAPLGDRIERDGTTAGGNS